MAEKRAISASSIKSLETCTWMFWQQYMQKVPQRTNEGALRGSLVHLVFELLLSKRHVHHYENIMRASDIKGSPAIRRLVIKHLRKDGILKPANYDMCNQMILVGLRSDFFCNGGKLMAPEYRFELRNENPEYFVRGYIDKLARYPGGKLKIVDYKSSKAKFKGDEIAANIQAMVYCLVAYKMLGAKDASADFVFLRFPRQPIQSVHPTKAQLTGLEEYLGYIYEVVNNFSEKDASSGFAANNEKNRWLCKAGSWECPYRRSFKYFALLNADGSIARTAMQKDGLTATEGQTLVERSYLGCPAFRQEIANEGLL